MSKKVLTNLDLNQNQILNAVEQVLATAPTNPVIGQHYYNSTTKSWLIYDGTAWKDASSGYTLPAATTGDLGGIKASTSIAVATDGTATVVNNSHEHTAANVTDLKNTVTGYSLDEFAAPAADLDINSKKLTNVADGTADSDAVNYGQIKDLAEKATTLAGYGITDAYTKTETDAAIDAKVASVYKYKGSVATFDDLPTEDLTIGDVYNVEAGGKNYAWTGTAWDDLGGIVDLSEYAKTADVVTLAGAQTITGAKTFSTAIVGDLTGTAAKATADAAGNVITTTYATKTEVEAKPSKFTATNPELTPVGGIATWTITNQAASVDVLVTVMEVATGEAVIVDVGYSSSNIVIKMNATATVAAGKYKAVIVG